MKYILASASPRRKELLAQAGYDFEVWPSGAEEKSGGTSPAEIVEELAKYAGVPVWNGLTNEYHPTQMLADMLTIREHFGSLRGIRLVYMGDARYNMGNSLMIACSKLGMHFVACTTKKYFPNEELVNLCQGWAKESGGTITLTENVEEGTKNADVIYTDVWVSMGEPDEVWAERIRLLEPYRVTKEVMAMADPSAIFLHCTGSNPYTAGCIAVSQKNMLKIIRAAQPGAKICIYKK